MNAIGLTTTTISARSGTTPGSGLVAIQKFSGGTLSDSGTIVTAYSYNGTAIGSGKYCTLTQLFGVWWIAPAEC